MTRHQNKQHVSGHSAVSGEASQPHDSKESPSKSDRNPPARPPGRPPYLVPITAEMVQPFLDEDPAPSIPVIAARLGYNHQRIYEWARQDRELAAALEILKTKHLARQLEKLESDKINPNAMFLCKAVHGMTDRPTTGDINVSIKIVQDRGVISEEQGQGGKNEVLEGEYQEVEE